MQENRPFFARCDLHVHSHLSPCGHKDMSPAAIINAAGGQGIDYLGITDHIHPYTDLSILDRLREEVAEVVSPVKVYIGCEADILDVGESMVSEALMSKVDYVMAAANHFHMGHVIRPVIRSKRDAALYFLDMFKYAASLEQVDIIAHPFYVMPGTFDPQTPAELTEEDLLPAIELAARNGIAMEISRKIWASDQIPFFIFFYKLCKRVGLKFAFGSDAHQIIDVGRTRLMKPLVREIGIEDDDIWLPKAKHSN